MNKNIRKSDCKYILFLISLIIFVISHSIFSISMMDGKKNNMYEGIEEKGIDISTNMWKNLKENVGTPNNTNNIKSSHNDLQFIARIYNNIISKEECDEIIRYSDEDNINIINLSNQCISGKLYSPKICILSRKIYGYISDISGYSISRVSDLNVINNALKLNNIIRNNSNNMFINFVLCLQAQSIYSKSFFLFEDINIIYDCVPGSILIWYTSPILDSKIITGNYKVLYGNVK